jgi:hypothetical protein
MAATVYRLALRHAGNFKWLVALAWGVVALGAFAGAWQLRGGLFTAVVLSLVAIVFVTWWSRWQRDRLIRESPLPQWLKRKLRQAHPGLSLKDAELVERGLRQFFLACHRSRGKFVAMPSRAVDTMWHDFILHTQAYRDWCTLALGRFLHHTPAEALGGQAKHNDGLRRAWFWTCKEEAINPRRPTRLPLLFALDATLNIPNGFRYAADCRDIAQKNALGADAATGLVYCGTSFSDGSAAGDSAGFGGEVSSGEGSGSDGSSSDGGDGGSGCGGGCGGGGGD